MQRRQVDLLLSGSTCPQGGELTWVEGSGGIDLGRDLNDLPRSTRVDLFLFFLACLKYFTRSILSNMISIPTNFQFPVSLLLFQ